MKLGYRDGLYSNISLYTAGSQLFSMKTRMSLYLVLTLTKKNFKIFFQKIKSIISLVHHVKGQPAASTYV